MRRLAAALSTIGAALLAVSVFVPVKQEWTSLTTGYGADYNAFVSWTLLEQSVVLTVLLVLCAIASVAVLALGHIRTVSLSGAVALSVAGYLLWTTYRDAHRANHAWAARREQLVSDVGHLRLDGSTMFLPEKVVLIGWAAHILLAGALALIAAAVCVRRSCQLGS